VAQPIGGLVILNTLDKESLSKEINSKSGDNSIGHYKCLFLGKSLLKPQIYQNDQATTN